MLRAVILILVSAGCAGCTAPSVLEPNGYAAVKFAGNQVYESHGYSLGSSIGFVLIEIYSDPETAQRTSAEQVRDDGLTIALNVGGQQIDNIRGTQKLYCDDGDVSDVVGSIPSFSTADEFILFCVETLTALE